MRQVPQIEAAYDWMVTAYEADVIAAMAAGNTQKLDKLEKTRDTFERGVFVVLFGQFELSVVDHFERARNNRTGNPDWTRRRGWDVPAYGNKRVPFVTQLTLVLDRQQPAYGQIMDAYGRRNHCAHGGTSEQVGSIKQFVHDLNIWQSMLRA